MMNVEKRYVSTALGVLFVSTLGLVGALLGLDNPMRTLAGFVLTMFAPGFALLFALMPRQNTTERLTLSAPLSFVLAVLNGLFFDQTPLGLKAAPMLLSLWAITAGLTVVGSTRIVRGAGNAGRPARMTLSVWPPRRALAEFGVGGLLLVVAGAWALSSLTSGARTTPQPFTALSIDGTTGPSTNSVDGLHVSLDNQESRPMAYDLEERIEGNVVARIPSIELEVGARQTLTLPQAPANASGVDVLVYRLGDTAPYRQVHVTPTEGG